MAYAKEKFFYFAVPTLEEAHGIISDRTFSYTEGLIGQGIYCFKRKEQSKTNTPVYNNSRLLCVNEFLFIFKAYKDGKFLFEAKLDIANVCSLSDPEGGLASTWQNQWDAAILQKTRTIRIVNWFVY